MMLVRVPRKARARAVARVRHFVCLLSVVGERAPTRELLRKARLELGHPALEARARGGVADARVHPWAVEPFARVEGGHHLDR